MSVSRLLSQGAKRLQSGLGHLTGLAKNSSTRPHAGSGQHVQPEGLGARHGRQGPTPMAPRNPARPGAARYSAPQGHAAPPSRPAPTRPAPQRPLASHGPAMPQPHFTQAQARPQARPQAQARPASGPVGLQHIAAMASPASAAAHAASPTKAAPLRTGYQPAPAGPVRRSHADEVADAAADLQEQVKASSRKLYDLTNARDSAETDEDYSAAEVAINALKQERAGVILMSNILSGADRGGARQMQALRGFSGAPALVDSRSLRHAGELRLQAQALRSNAAALRSAQAQFGPVSDLAGKAQTLRTALKQHELPLAARQELESVLRGFENYAALDAMVRDADRALRRMGGMGMMDGIPTTAAERRAADDAERRAAQEALDNGY